jgi:hypothetical protein
MISIIDIFENSVQGERIRRKRYMVTGAGLGGLAGGAAMIAKKEHDDNEMLERARKLLMIQTRDKSGDFADGVASGLLGGAAGVGLGALYHKYKVKQEKREK